MDFLGYRSFGKSVLAALVAHITFARQANFCDGGVRFWTQVDHWCMLPQFVSSCGALLPSGMIRESQLGVLPVVTKFDLRGEQCTAPRSVLFRMFVECFGIGV